MKFKKSKLHEKFRKNSHDCISNNIIKIIREDLIKPIVHIKNAVLNKGNDPEVFKPCTVKLIYKAKLHLTLNLELSQTL